ncbi:MAG: 50S ribosomal protein L3 [Candidatus Omnitrophota bacterium]
MKLGLLGKKIGMTQIFTEEGRFVPVTVIEAGPCVVLNVKKDKVLLGFGDKKEKRTPKQQLALYKKYDVSPKTFLKEVFFDKIEDVSIGKSVTVDIFKENDYVDVSGTSKGKGFQGGVRRWGWAGGPGGHGSMHHRRIGSIGASSFPSKVNKGQHMPGRMGNVRKTVQNLKIVKVYNDKNILLVKGCIPGASNSFLEIRLAKKKKAVREEVKIDQKKDNK